MTSLIALLSLAGLVAAPAEGAYRCSLILPVALGLAGASFNAGSMALMQTSLTLVFVWDLLSSLLGLRAAPISWQVRELLEIGAAVGLLIGLGMGALVLRRAERRSARVEDQAAV